MSGSRARRQRQAAAGSGLRVPHGSRASDLGLVSRYLTAGDLTDHPEGLETVVAALMAVPVERALGWAAEMFAPSGFGKTWRAQQAEQARLWFNASTSGGRRARDLVLSGERLLLAPQVLLVLARLAAVHCPRGRVGEDETVEEIAAGINGLRSTMLVLAHHLGAQRREADRTATDGGGGGGGRRRRVGRDGVRGRPGREPAPEPGASVFDRFERRWREIPAERAGDRGTVDLFGEYEAATGVRLDDLAMVALTLWARAIGDDGPRVGPGHLDDLGLGPDRTANALGLLSDTVEGLAARSAGSEADADPELDMTLFGRTPVVRLGDAGLVVVSPVLLLERAFGWLPVYDIEQGFAAARSGGRARAAAAVQFLRRTSEAHAVEAFRHAAEAGQKPGRVYGEAEIQRAYGTGRPNADTACQWDADWVVAEVSSRKVTRRTAAAASATDLINDLDKGIVDKARQLDGTIAALRADETRLTGAPAAGGPGRYWPVVVATEGFPVNPLTVRRLRRMVRDAGYLTGDDTAGLVVVDPETLEAVETLAERGVPPLPRLLAEHAASEQREYGLREWLLLRYPGLRPPTRVMARWARAFDPALAALTTGRPAESPADSA